MPFVSIRVTPGPGVTPERKRIVARGVLRLLEEHMSKKPEWTHIVFEEIAEDDWFNGARSIDGDWNDQ